MDWLVAHFAAIVFYFAAAIAVVGAGGVIYFKHPVHAALSLLMTFLAVAGLFILQHAEFLAAVQILVYAGGVIVLFLFVIMLVNVRALPREAQYVNALMPAAITLAAALAIALGISLWPVFAKAPAAGAALVSVQGQVLGNTEAVGWALYRHYLLPFEVVSILLLVAMVGAIVLGRREKETEGQA